MRLNHDCIRDIMLYIEDNTPGPYSCVDFESLCTSLQQYDQSTIHYHINQLSQGGFIKCQYADNRPYYISPLTPEGHEYLDNIRDKTAWKKLKESGLSSMSLEVTKELAKEVVLALVKDKLKLK